MPRTKTKPSQQLSTRLGRNVRERRKALGLSQEALAFAAQVDAASLSRIESGRVGDRGVGLGRIARLAHALKVAPEVLLSP